MATPLTLRTQSSADGTPRLIAAGEIDLSNVAGFTQALAELSAGTPETVTVDLSAVKYLDSAGINALFDYADKVDRLRLIVHPFLIRVLAISGLSTIAIVEPAPAGGDSGGGEGV